MTLPCEPSLLPLELDAVRFELDGRRLLSDVSLTFGRTGKTIVMGPNGAGKSLLMRLCHGLLRPTAGSITWAGTLGSDPDAVRRRQAMVFQRPVLLRRSAVANVTYALAARGIGRRARRAQAMEALERFGLTDRAERPARVLSGGEQQRLALARAWCLHPEVLFLDEPTSALDPSATRAVEAAVETFYRAGTRIIMSSHDLGQARRLADDIVFVCGGRIVEHTAAERFFELPTTAEGAAFLRGELVG